MEEMTLSEYIISAFMTVGSLFSVRSMFRLWKRK